MTSSRRRARKAPPRWLPPRRRSDVNVFLTGASSGIGEALARHYAAGGATLGLVARRQEMLAKLQSSLGVPTEIFPCDVRDLAGMTAAAGRFMDSRGVPDIVIANAGVSYGTLTQIAEDVDTFRETLDINV